MANLSTVKDTETVLVGSWIIFLVLRSGLTLLKRKTSAGSCSMVTMGTKQANSVSIWCSKSVMLSWTRTTRKRTDFAATIPTLIRLDLTTVTSNNATLQLAQRRDLPMQFSQQVGLHTLLSLQDSLLNSGGPGRQLLPPELWTTSREWVAHPPLHFSSLSILQYSIGKDECNAWKYAKQCVHFVHVLTKNTRKCADIFVYSLVRAFVSWLFSTSFAISVVEIARIRQASWTVKLWRSDDIGWSDEVKGNSKDTLTCNHPMFWEPGLFYLQFLFHLSCHLRSTWRPDPSDTSLLFSDAGRDPIAHYEGQENLHDTKIFDKWYWAFNARNARNARNECKVSARCTHCRWCAAFQKRFEFLLRCCLGLDQDVNHLEPDNVTQWRIIEAVEVDAEKNRRWEWSSKKWARGETWSFRNRSKWLRMNSRLTVIFCIKRIVMNWVGCSCVTAECSQFKSNTTRRREWGHCTRTLLRWCNQCNCPPMWRSHESVSRTENSEC